MYKYLLFDLDETILNFRKTEEMAFKDLMEEFNIPFSKELSDYYTEVNESLWKALERKEITKQYLKDTRFGPVYDKAKELFPDFKAPRPDIVKMNQRYMEMFSKYAFYLDGAEDMLKAVRHYCNSNGIKMYVITNGTKFTAESRISISGVDKYMDGIFISDVIGINKPDKGFFDYVMQNIEDTSTDNYLVIGDSLTSDIKGAINSNMASCLFVFQGEYPEGYRDMNITYKVRGFKELTNLLTNI